MLLQLLAVAASVSGPSNQVAASCGVGWQMHGTHCYKGFTLRSSWQEANNTCSSEGATLVRPRTDDQQQFIVTDVGLHWGCGDPSCWYWTDLTGNYLQKNVWRFSDGSVPTDTQWRSNYPIGYDGYNCVSLLPQWVNIPCTATRPFVCERPSERRATPPVAADDSTSTSTQ